MSDRPAIDGGEPVRESVLGYGGQSIGQREKEAVLEVLESDYITRGPKVDAFEEAVASSVGVEHAIAVTSGTAALHLVGETLFEEGDEVITTPLTFVATANAAVHAGATPVFADVKRETRNLDPAAVSEAITEDTVAVVPVHYAGQPCDVEEILSIAEDHDLDVVWDACHAIGSEWRGEPVGSQPNVSVFSFHPVKTITTGEGGMVVTDDDSIAERVRSLRSFDMDYSPAGHDDEPWFQVARGPGYNYNVTDFQAALGLVQLERLDSFKARRDKIAARYDAALADVPGIRTPFAKDDVDPAWHLYSVEITDDFGCSRKRFVNAMHAENIGVQVHYVPLHFHPYFQRKYGYERGDFPVAEEVYERLVSLPLFPAMGDEDVEDVIRAVEGLAEHV